MTDPKKQDTEADRIASDYAALRGVLDRAYDQASVGKGRERHANGEPFEDQLIVKLGQFMGHRTEGNVFQACKKSIESLRLPKSRAIPELLGAINYIAGAVLILENAPEENRA
jgi:hypothetical protein